MILVLELLAFAVCLLRTLPEAAWLAAQRALGLDSSSRDWAAPPPDSFDVVCISHVEWNYVWQRNQHTMSRLARHGNVLYCFPVKQRAYRLHWLDVLRGARRTPSGVHLWYPLVLPGSRLSGWIEGFNKWFLAASLKRLQTRLGIRRPALWYYFPDLVFLVGQLGERALVYDIQDDYSHFEWSSPKIRERERSLLERADQVFTGTHALYEKHRAAARRIRFVLNGVDFDAFHGVRASLPSAPARHSSLLAGIAGPVMGYFGLIDERVDLDLIDELARRRPQWHFLMVGPVVTARRPGVRPNVIFTGQVSYADLPAIAQRFDVCLMPFVQSNLTAAINPTKTLEYFALERPVVSSPIPDVVRFYGDTIDFARTPDEWEQAIERALRQPDPARLAKALENARGRSWDATVRDFRNEIVQILR
ncbi:glycosyltransferase [Candidatus Sumerlaeota bacterium]|nr:glycosyltransferase [Candidatus Sumerlaeota bacterium]